MLCRLIFFTPQSLSYEVKKKLQLLKLLFSVAAALTEEARPSFGGNFNHISECGFVFMSPCLLMRLRGESAVGGHILHVLILPAKSLISLTQVQEEPRQLRRTKGHVSEQAPPPEVRQKLKEGVIVDREWDSKSRHSPICLI